MTVPRLQLATPLEAEHDRIVRLAVLGNGRVELRQALQAGELVEDEPDGPMGRAPGGHEPQDVQRLKQQLHDRAARTVNNVLTVLNVLLKTAVSWDVIERMPCSIRLLPVPISAASFLDFDEYEQLVTAAAGERDASLTVLLGGERDCVAAR
jgi:hypothetical protein